MLIIKRRKGEGLAIYDSKTDAWVGDVIYARRAPQDRAAFLVERAGDPPRPVEIRKGQTLYFPDLTGRQAGLIEYAGMSGTQAILAIDDPNRRFRFARHEVDRQAATRKENQNDAART